MAAKRGRKSGKWTGDFDSWLKLQRSASPLTEPIPPSRDLAASYAVNHTTIFRHLQRLEGNGVLWKADNGRFFFAEARRLLKKPRPVACLFRKLENWSLLYQEMMEGIAQECEQQELGTLLWHDDLLVRHTNPAAPPVFSTAPQQLQSLNRFLDRYGDEVDGIILDQAWSTDALARLPGNLQDRSVLLGRPSRDRIPAAFPDFSQATHLALTHLRTAGYQRVHPVRPFSGDPSVDYCLGCMETALLSEEFASMKAPLYSVETAKTRRQLIAKLAKAGSGPLSLLFPEDNSAVNFWHECLAAGLQPGQVGIVSLQGTRAAGHGQISHVRTDYHALGRHAVGLCLKLTRSVTPGAPSFVSGKSTFSA